MSLAEDLLVAVRSGQHDLVLRLLRQGAIANGRGMLHYAAEKGFVDIAETLLKHGAKVDAWWGKEEPSKYGLKSFTQMLTPLCLAIQQGHVDIVKVLLKHGAYVNSEFKYDPQPIFTAVIYGREEIVSALLEFKADVNMRFEDFEGQLTPLHIAAYLNNHAMCTLLLTNGADVNAMSAYGETPLCSVVVRRRRRHYYDDDCPCESLLWRCCPNFKNTCTKRHDEKKDFSKVIEVLLQGGSNANFALKNVPLLHKALENCESVSCESIKLLLEHGASADVNLPVRYRLDSYLEDKSDEELDVELDDDEFARQQDKFETRTALFVAVTQRGPDVFKLLLDFGADVDFRNSRGETAFTSEFSAYGLWCSQHLLTLMPINSACWVAANGYTPLHHVASEFQYVEFFEEILELGGDLNKVSNDGKTPFEILIDMVDLKYYPRDRNNYLGVLKLCVCEIMRMEGLKLWVSDRNLQALETCDVAVRYKKEFEAMKSETLGESNVCYFSIFTKSRDDLVKLLRNKDVFDCLESELYEAKFPLCANDIKRKFVRAKDRRILLDLAEKLFCDKIFNLPDIICSMIFDKLSRTDLKFFINVFEEVAKYDSLFSAEREF